MPKKLTNRLILIFLPVLCTLFYMGWGASTPPAPKSGPASECCRKYQEKCEEKPGTNNLSGSQFFTGA